MKVQARGGSKGEKIYEKKNPRKVLKTTILFCHTNYFYLSNIDVQIVFKDDRDVVNTKFAESASMA